MITIILILLSILYPADTKTQASRTIISDTEPFYNYKKDKVFIVNNISNAPTIDGILNEDCWQDLKQLDSESNYIDDFTQDYPSNLSSPSFRSIVSIGSDSKNIYIGARLFDSTPDSIMQRLSRRDNIDPWLSDWFSIELDSNHDHETAYRFAVNSSGVQLDGVIYADSEFDIQYNGVWESDVQIDEYGWKVEMKIPFKMLSITQIENPWGLNISRFIFRYNEINRWVVFEEGVPGRVSKFGHAIGFEEIDIKRGIEFKPYFLFGHDRYNNSILTDPERIPYSHFINSSDSLSNNIGIDLKYRLSASSALELTINPDFGQIEMDPKYINLTYYEIILPERRSFFNETEAMFDMPISLFYSRRIGESSSLNSHEYRINAALKLMGDTRNKWKYGFIFADTSPRGVDNYPKHRKNYIISRATTSFFDGKSKVGFSHTNFYFNLDQDNMIIEESYALDHISYLLSNQIFIDYQIAQSIRNSVPNQDCIDDCDYDIVGNGYRFTSGYSSSSPFSFILDIEDYDKNFSINRVGSLMRNNIKKYQFGLGYKIIDPIRLIREIKINLVRSESLNYDNLKIGDKIGIESIIESENYSYIRFSYHIDFNHYDDYLTYDPQLNKVGLPFLLPKSTQSAIKFYSDRRGDFSFNIGIEYKESEIHRKNIFNSDDNYIGFDFELNSRIDFLSIRHMSFSYENQKMNQAYGFIELLSEEISDEESLEHNIFSNTKGWMHRYSITLEEYFTDKISLGIYCEYLQRFSKYSNYTELVDEDEFPQVTDFITGYTYQDQEWNDVIVPPAYTNDIAESPEEDEDGFLVQDLNPNYYIGFYPRYTNLNLNFSFKWEYSPSSDIYVIYRLTRSVNGKIFPTINDFLMHNRDDIWSEKYFDASFYIKFNYWFNI